MRPSPSPDGQAGARGLPDWRVLVVGGASGMGKTGVARALARRYDVPVVEVDDIVEALLAVTRPEHLPEVHHWRTHPEAARRAPESVAERQIAIAEALAPAVEAVVANHVGTDTPVILEGDYVLPEVATPGGAVRAVFLHEDDEARVTDNYLRREPEAGPQHHRARVSVLYGRRLAARARAAGVPVVAPRPWEDLAGRVVATLGPARGEAVVPRPGGGSARGRAPGDDGAARDGSTEHEVRSVHGDEAGAPAP
ncbi:hypothetical protein [Streptomyces sp. NPDC015130]|uniref:hypothetical protein n=1 Tax=Streptomyces sp. NPDC015130 TaxID=3364940 RepID=UPI0036FE30D7